MGQGAPLGAGQIAEMWLITLFLGFCHHKLEGSIYGSPDIAGVEFPAVLLLTMEQRSGMTGPSL